MPMEANIFRNLYSKQDIFCEYTQVIKIHNVALPFYRNWVVKKAGLVI
jgi:hypothetical protein